MLVRMVSDLHLEFGHNLQLPHLPEDKETVLLVAGDLTNATQRDVAYSWLADHAERFRHIIYVLGNHEYYDGHFKGELARRKLHATHWNNVTIADRESVIIDDVKFVCATLWTDFGNHNSMAMMLAQYRMNDYRYISTDNEDLPGKWRTLNPEDTYHDHLASRDFIVNELSKNEYKHVVVTHHLPSHQCSPDKYSGDELQLSYASDLDWILYDYKIVMWVFGHTHGSCDKLINDVMMVGNPFGYYRDEINREFDSKMRKEI